MGFLALLWILSGFLSKWVFWLYYEFLLYFFQMGFLAHYGFLFCIFKMGSLAQPYDEFLLCFFPNWFFSGQVKQRSFSCSKEKIHQHWCLSVLCMQLLKLFLRQSWHLVPHEQSKSIPVSSQNVWLFVQCPQLDRSYSFIPWQKARPLSLCITKFMHFSSWPGMLTHPDSYIFRNSVDAGGIFAFGRGEWLSMWMDIRMLSTNSYIHIGSLGTLNPKPYINAVMSLEY